MRTAGVELGWRWTLLGLALGAGTAVAEIDLSVTVATDYLHRGLEQTLSGPAYQAAAEYRHESGWFAGLWASRVNFEPFDDRRLELDYYGGYGRRLSPQLALEAAVIRYDYRGTAPHDYDWTELQATAYLGDRLSITAAVADNWWASDRRTQLLEATLRQPLPAALTVDATLGRQFGRDAVGTDYDFGQVGLSRPVGRLVVRLGYAWTDADARARFRPLTGQRWVASVTWRR